MTDNKVHRSIEAPGGHLCIDIFQRPDGSWGFAEYRRDPEDPRGWAPTFAFADSRHETSEQALAAVQRSVPWIGDSL